VLRGYLAVQALSVALSFLDAGLGGLSFPVPQLFGNRVLGLLATAAAVTGSVALGRRRPTRRGLVVLGNLGLSLFAVAMLLKPGASEAYDDQYHPEYVTTYTEPAAGLRADGKEISNLFPFDEDGKPLHNVYLVDRDGNPVGNRYPQRQRQLDHVTGERSPASATPEFRPPPGPVRAP
jgi:hypothetical protein